MNPILAQWNAAELEEATRQILPCCGSHAWAAQLAATRPYLSAEALAEASSRIWRTLPEADQQEAFATHPRIGERHATATPQSLAWSAQEQAPADKSTQTELAQANRAYEARFGRTFIICATGKTPEEMLAILNDRLVNNPEQELAEAAEQQRQITQLRLQKWLQP